LPCASYYAGTVSEVASGDLVGEGSTQTGGNFGRLFEIIERRNVERSRADRSPAFRWVAQQGSNPTESKPAFSREYERDSLRPREWAIGPYGALAPDRPSVEPSSDQGRRTP
jgi:hypothetical protein